MKKNYANKEIIKTSFFLCLVCFFINACYEDREGCLDVNATNFDVQADVDCCIEAPCCCLYPELKLEVLHKLTPDSVDNFGFNQQLTLDSIHYFIVEDMKFYLTNLRVVNSATGEEAGVSNTIELDVLENGIPRTIITEDNFTIIKKTDFSYNIGSFETPFTYDEIRFDVGIAGLANHTIIDNLSTIHPLHLANDSLHISPGDGYIFNKIDLYRDTALTTLPTNLEIKTLIPIQLSFPTPKIVQRGFDCTIFLRINYLEWFKGINFVDDTKEQLVTKITENTENVFQLSD